MTDKERADRLAKILQHALAEKTGVYFICGEGGEKDCNGLPETVFICPAYGADWFRIYRRVDE